MSSVPCANAAAAAAPPVPDAAVTDALSLQREDISTMHDASNNILPRLVYLGLTFFVERDTNNTYHQDVQYRERAKVTL